MERYGLRKYIPILPLLMSGCSAEITIPAADAGIVGGDAVASSFDAWRSRDVPGIDCNVIVSKPYVCTDQDTKISYETGHLGCKYRHDRCADYEGDNFFWDRSKQAGSGLEPMVDGRWFDYLRKATMAGSKDVLGEAKTTDIAIDLPQFIVDSTANMLLPDILKEFEIAKQCGYRYELLVSDGRLAKTLALKLPLNDPDFLFREVQSCRP